MKRIIALLLAILLEAVVLAGCTQTGPNEKINVVCTIFPQYDWVRQILAEKSDDIELTLLLDGKIDLHNYQPSVDDIVKISSCDLFIYVGGESDDWVMDVLRDATNKDMVAINLLETLGDLAKIEEVKEGMEYEEHGHDDEEPGDEEEAREDGTEHEDGHDAEYDEHIWLSLKNAKVLCPVIADALSSLDNGNAETYRANLSAYLEKLSALDSEYQSAVNVASVKTLLFGDRFPFRYLVDDYELDYHAAFVGCSAETEASFDTIIFLAGKVDEQKLKHIMVTESSDQKIAKTIQINTVDKNQQILVMNALQSVSKSDVNNGTTYLSIMESNLGVLKNALQ